MTCRVGPAAWPVRGHSGARFAPMKHLSLAVTLLLATCVLPGEPSNRIVYDFLFDQPYRVPIGTPDSTIRGYAAFPRITATADGTPLNNPRHRPESSNANIVRADSSRRGLQGFARRP